VDDDGGLQAVKQIRAQHQVKGQIGDDGQGDHEAGRAQDEGGVRGAGDRERVTIGRRDGGQYGGKGDHSKSGSAGGRD